MSKVWTYRSDVQPDVALVGFDVEALDGHIGKVDQVSAATDTHSLVVDTGFWIFGKKRSFPWG